MITKLSHVQISLPLRQRIAGSKSPEGANGMCKARQCTEEKSIPQVLLCAACTPWAAAKGWASFSILMCRKLEHGKDQPKPAEVRKFLEKYLGKISIPDNKLNYTANFNYQAFSVSETPIPASTCTPTLTLSSALRLILPQL